VVEEMLALRKEYKAKMKAAEDYDERRGYDMLQTATKVAVNALYGMVSMNKIGGMWSDLDIGRTITYMGRESIKFLLAESEKMGYRGLYGHTDSAFIQVPFEEAENLASHLTKKAQEDLDMPYMDVELEAYFDYWMTASTKNRYFGIKVWPESDKGSMKISGFEVKASNSAPISKRVQETAMQLVGNGADEQEVNDAIRPISIAVKKGDIPVDELSPYGRVKRKFSKYESNVPLPVRAAKYYNDNMQPEEPFRPGDGAQWVFVKGVPEGMSNTVRVRDKTFDANVVAFRDPSEMDDFVLDYDIIVEKMIRAKLKNIFDTMGWDLDNASGAPVPEVYW
jgi:DNA polymerase elongation subunit (family B)